MIYGLAGIVTMQKIIEGGEADRQHKWTARHKLNANGRLLPRRPCAGGGCS